MERECSSVRAASVLVSWTNVMDGKIAKTSLMNMMTAPHIFQMDVCAPPMSFSVQTRYSRTLHAQIIDLIFYLVIIEAFCSSVYSFA